MEKSKENLYTEQYSEMLAEVSKQYERQDLTANQISWCSIVLAIAVGLGCLAFGLFPFHAKGTAQLFIVVICGIALAGGGMRNYFLKGSNSNFKNKIVKAITEDEVPNMTYTQNGTMPLKELSLLYGKDLKCDTEDFFEGTADGNIPFTACEVTLRTKERNPTTKFQGYVWRFKTNMQLGQCVTYHSRECVDTGIFTKRLVQLATEPDKPCLYVKGKKDKPFRISSRMWNAAEKVAKEVKGRLCMCTTGQYLYVGINTAHDLFEVDGNLDEEGLRKVAADIRYVNKLPQHIGLAEELEVRMRLTRLLTT